ncbi:hypothetical protein CRYUN_Cryun17cG0114700 [Craigia yunnanensis]
MKMVKCFMIVLLLGFCHVSMAAPLEKKDQRKTYIVHMAKSEMPASFQHHTHWYDSSLKSVSGSAQMLYTYDNVIHGFSTQLTNEEAQQLESQPGILAVLPELRYELHTTRTPEFLGLSKAADSFPEFDSVNEVIIGVLDTGVWPESKSFADTGLGPIPSSWKGACESGTNFSSSNCNRKLIGARYFANGYEATLGPIDESKESKSPRDDDGHGTHTASTAAGSVVEGASLFGYAQGTARGMSTRARVAVYKVCWIGGCFSSDILAAMEKAIDDNVNVLSMSLGGGMSDYYRDSVAIGSFAAMEKGILVSCSAGNAGPGPYSLSNLAPWITTVGAGTLDRDFPAYVSLGNGRNYSGVSLYRGSPLPGKLLPFVYAGNASNATNGNLCMMGTLIPEKVAGKIVLCDRGMNARVQKGAVVKAAGAGHVDPVSALNPGLVYDLTVEDYLGFLCALNYTEFQIRALARRNFSCDASKKYRVTDLNYPSFAVNFDAIMGGSNVVKYTRTLTNVGSPGTYKVSISPETSGVKISIEPETLSFSQANEKKSYTITFTGSSQPSNTFNFARLEWSDGKYTVGSPIAVSWT